MNNESELKARMKKTRRQNTPPDATDDLRTQEAANYMIAEKEIGQQNDNNRTI